jgi:large subunit ribosomal protein L21
VYAVIKTGGKQYRVSEGERLAIERVAPEGEGDSVSFVPILLVDGESVTAKPADLAEVTVSARILGEEKGEKIRGFTYKPKSNNRRRWGHRQKYTTIEITGIGKAGQVAAAPAESEPEPEPADSAPATEGSES